MAKPIIKKIIDSQDIEKIDALHDKCRTCMCNQSMNSYKRINVSDIIS